MYIFTKHNKNRIRVIFYFYRHYSTSLKNKKRSVIDFNFNTNLTFSDITIFSPFQGKRVKVQEFAKDKQYLFCPPKECRLRVFFSLGGRYRIWVEKEGNRATGGELRATNGRWSPRYHLHGFRPASIRHYSSRNARHNLENRAVRAPCRYQRFSTCETRPRFGGQPPLGVVYQRGTIELELSKIILHLHDVTARTTPCVQNLHLQSVFV